MGGYSVVNSPFVVGPLNNASTGMRGGLAFGAIVAAYGQDHLTKAGRIQMSVPNAAKSGWKDALHIDGVTDNPIVTIDGDLDMSNTHLLGRGSSIRLELRRSERCDIPVSPERGEERGIRRDRHRGCN
jgi:hypothetical protein